MSFPIEITDPRLVKAYSHPLRVRIHTLLDGRVASPSQIATELDVPLSTASYHVRRLLSLGLIELVERVSKRGAIEHRYTARYHAITSDEEWGALPTVLKRTYLGGLVEYGWRHVTAAAEEGGFDRPDVHYSRTFGRLDDIAWREVADELKRTLTRLEDILRACEARAAASSDGSRSPATIILMHFAGPDELVSDAGTRVDGIRAASSSAIRAEEGRRTGG